MLIAICRVRVWMADDKTEEKQIDNIRNWMAKKKEKIFKKFTTDTLHLQHLKQFVFMDRIDRSQMQIKCNRA
jgi:hypothetical protein